jgi:hypothetical protein
LYAATIDIAGQLTANGTSGSSPASNGYYGGGGASAVPVARP